MGFSLSWVAVRAGDEDAVYRTLGFRQTGRFEGGLRATFCGSPLRTGWILVVWTRHLAALDGTVDLRRLSALGEVIACLVEEHVGCTAVANWRSGIEVWSLRYDAELGTQQLERFGEVPILVENLIPTTGPQSQGDPIEDDAVAD